MGADKGRLKNGAKKNLPVKMKAKQMAADGHTKRRILVLSMRYGLTAQPALLVRGSSRRIMTLRFRPAYIRVINRRYLLPAATCSAFQKQPGWIFLCRGKSSPEKQPIQHPVKPAILSVA